MTWEAAAASIFVLALSVAVEVVRRLSKRGRESREQAGIDATTDLTVAQARQVAEDVEGKKLDRTERMWDIITELRERVDTLDDALDAERRARQDAVRTLRHGLKVTRDYAEALRLLVPPPPPEYPVGWHDIHDATD